MFLLNWFWEKIIGEVGKDSTSRIWILHLEIGFSKTDKITWFLDFFFNLRVMKNKKIMFLQNWSQPIVSSCFKFCRFDCKGDCKSSIPIEWIWFKKCWKGLIWQSTVANFVWYCPKIVSPKGQTIWKTNYGVLKFSIQVEIKKKCYWNSLIDIDYRSSSTRTDITTH